MSILIHLGNGLYVTEEYKRDPQDTINKVIDYTGKKEKEKESELWKETLKK
jgi:hypothetical protein